MPTVTLTANLTYTPPGGTAGSGTAGLTVAQTSNAQNVGTIDVPDATAAATAYVVPFGSVALAQTVIIRNRDTGQPLTLTVNAAALYDIPDGGEFFFMAPVAGTAGTPLAAVTLTTTAIQSGLGSIDFWIFGD